MFSQASSGGGLDGFGASPLLVNGTIRTNVLWGADTGSSKLMVWVDPMAPADEEDEDDSFLNDL